NMGDMMDLIDQHIAYAWKEDGTDRFTRGKPEPNIARLESLWQWGTVVDGVPRTIVNNLNPTNISINEQKYTRTSTSNAYLLTSSSDPAYYSGMTDRSKTSYANYLIGDKVLFSIDYKGPDATFGITKWYMSLDGSNITRKNRGATTYRATLPDGYTRLWVYTEVNEGDIDYSFEIPTGAFGSAVGDSALIRNLRISKSNETDESIMPIYTTNPQDDYDNAVPRYIGRSLKDSNSPADYTWEPNPDRKPWTAYAQGLNGEDLSLMPYGEQLQLGTNQPFTMGYGISNTAWKDGWAYLDTKPENTAFSNEILPQNGMFYNFVPENGKTYTQSIRIKTDAKYNPNNYTYFSWFTTDGHNSQNAKILPLSNNEYLVYSTCVWNKTGKNLRSFDIFNLHTAFGFRDSTATYLAFKDLKLEPANTMGIPTPWTPAPSEDPLGAIPKYVGTAALPYEDFSKYAWDLNPAWLQQESNNNLANKVDNDTYNNDQSNVWTEISNRVTEEEAQAIQKSLNKITGAYTDFVSTGGKHDQDLANLKSAINTDIQKLADKVLGFDFVNTWFRIGDGGLSIGEANSNFEILISNDQITFYDSGTAVAYVSNQSFFINSGMIVDDLQIGKFKFAKVNDNLMGLFHIA
ncbi:hypothetical protein ACS8BZ_08185, partial [Enterococcus italicus]